MHQKQPANKQRTDPDETQPSDSQDGDEKFSCNGQVGREDSVKEGGSNYGSHDAAQNQGGPHKTGRVRRVTDRLLRVHQRKKELETHILRGFRR